MSKQGSLLKRLKEWSTGYILIYLGR